VIDTDCKLIEVTPPIIILVGVHRYLETFTREDVGIGVPTHNVGGG